MTKTDELLAVEAEHGFVFGVPDDHAPANPAPVIAVVACVAPTCQRRGQQHQVHADTVQPLHCGGCFAVLHCDHDTEEVVYHDGTIVAPLRQTVNRCVKCGTVTAQSSMALPPVALESIPLQVLAAGLDAFLRGQKPN